MTTALDEPTSHTPPATRLRTTMAAVRLSISWFGIRKTLTAEQKARAASTFGAEGNYLSAGKKLLNTSHPEYRALTSVRSRIQSYFNGISLPYPEPAVRLIRQNDIQTFDAQLTTLKTELSAAVLRLDTVYAELKATARQRLGSLYNERDYPESLNGLLAWNMIFPVWSLRITYGSSTPSCTGKNASGSALVLTKPCNWRSSRSWMSWPRW